MAILRHFPETSIAQSAYLVGCEATGRALVVDPTIDIQPYIDAALAEGLTITDVAETHIHADFVSGGRALAQATNATLHVSGEGGADWQYAFAGEPGVRTLRHGDVIEVGRVRLDVVHTPGHTPEHLMFVMTDTAAGEVAIGAFTGDFLFVGDVGRPDLLETAAGQAGTMEASARQLFASLRTLTALPDHLVIWPAHGSGSVCGRKLGGVPVSSLGYERLTNWALHETDEARFVAAVLADQPDPPMYFAEMKRVNRHGSSGWSPGSPLPAVEARALDALVAERTLVIDVRATRPLGILPGAVAVPLERSFSLWAGAVIPPATFFIVASDQDEAEVARRSLALIGRTSAAGWVSNGTLDAYRANGGRFESFGTASGPSAGQIIVDVRTTSEWQAGHIEGAVHVPLARLPERIGALDRSSPVLVYCQAGARAAVAATALRRLGFSDVSTLEGGLDAYHQRTGAVPAGDVLS